MQQLGVPQNAQNAGLPNGSAGTNDDVVVEEAIVPVDDVEPPTKSEFAKAFKVSALPAWDRLSHLCQANERYLLQKHRRRKLTHYRKSPGPNGVALL